MAIRPLARSRIRLIGTACVAATLAAWASPVSAADPAAGRQKARVCQTCHGLDGIGRMPTVPHIAGESEIYLAKQLKAFRSGERTDPQMAIVAKPLTDEEIANLAAWYASIKFTVEVPE